jgi:hypothetical protein
LASSKHIFPPSAEDYRIVDFVAAEGGITIAASDVGYAVREACALSIGQTAAYAITRSVDDLWLEFLAAQGISDTSEPFEGEALLAGILTEDGDPITKQDGKSLIQE